MANDVEITLTTEQKVKIGIGVACAAIGGYLGYKFGVKSFWPDLTEKRPGWFEYNVIDGFVRIRHCNPVSKNSISSYVTPEVARSIAGHLLEAAEAATKEAVK